MVYCLFHYWRCFLLLLILAVCTPIGRCASDTQPLENPWPRTAITLRWENDIIGGTDENYSNGISLSMTRRGRGLLGRVWDWVGLRDIETYYGYELGQIMITPSDKSLLEPRPDDRPYAGILYGSLSTMARRENQLHGFKLVLGVVGPWSLAKETQIWWHDVIGSPRPMGWHHQLPNEPILNLVYEYRRKYTLFGDSQGFGSELIPMAGAMAGNVLVQAEAGAQVRLGWHLPDDFGTTLIRGFGYQSLPRFDQQPAAAKWGAFLFGGVAGNAVARNLTLDGSTFRSSPHVSKRPLFGAAEVGVGIWMRRLQINASTVFWGREFRTQERYSIFGALTVSVFF